MTRWLLPLLAVFALLGNAVTTYAAAGMIGESSCCCPKPEHCKCHDHDGKPVPNAELKRCGGEAKLVPLAVAAAIVAIQIDVTNVPVVSALPPPALDPIPDDVSREPETPPF